MPFNESCRLNIVLSCLAPVSSTVKPTVAVAKKQSKSSSDSDSSDATEKKSAAVVANKPKPAPVSAKKPAPSSSSSDSDDGKAQAKPAVKSTVGTLCTDSIVAVSYCSCDSHLRGEADCSGNSDEQKSATIVVIIGFI